MGLKSSPDLEIERIDNSKGYSKANCVWATDIEQANNKRSNHLYTIGEVTKTIAEWARWGCIEYHSLYRRIVDDQWHPELIRRLLEIYQERANLI
jgi:hypothetical protein